MWLCAPTSSLKTRSSAPQWPSTWPLFGQPVAVDAVHVPAVLPLRRFVRQIEALPQAREVHADRQRSVAEPVVAFVGACLRRRIRDTRRTASRPGKMKRLVNEASWLPNSLVLASRRCGCRSCCGLDKRSKKSLNELPPRCAAAELQQAIGARATSPRPAPSRCACRRAAGCRRCKSARCRSDARRERRSISADEQFIVQPEARERRVVRERDRGQRLRLGADQHRAVGERRKPVRDSRCRAAR